MARWRAEAIERLPSLRGLIAAADTVMGLWIDLFLEFERAYRGEPRDDAMIAGIYSYADWCLAAPGVDDAGRDPVSAVIVAFYEDIPAFGPARQDMPRWFTLQEVIKNQAVFSYHLSTDEYHALVRHMRLHPDWYQRPKSAEVKTADPLPSHEQHIDEDRQRIEQREQRDLS